MVETVTDVQNDIITDANVFNKQSSVLTDEKELEFTVRDPQDHGGHIVYLVMGKDLQGDFECKRRYSEFFALYESLAKRWPGIMLPVLPGKKAVGNKDLVFIQERRFYLERFLRKLAKYDFIINSQEFQLFVRPQGLDVEKSLSKLPKLSISQLYDRLKEATQTDEKIDEISKETYEQNITEFQFFVKKVDPFLRQLRGDLTSFLSKKQQVMMNYAGMSKVLNEYEDLNLSHYTDMESHRLVLNNPSNSALKESMLHTIENLRNPFTDLYHWVKGEVYDLTAFNNAVEERKKILNRVKELKKKAAGTKKDIESVNEGKKTVSTLFKDQNDVGAMTHKIENTERELEIYIQLLDVMTVYLGRAVLPAYKAEKLRLYQRILQQFHVVEISNSHQLASFWSQVLQVDNVKNANSN